METLIGTIITCSLTIMIHHPVLKRDMEMRVDNVACKVVDDRYMSVGTTDYKRQPILIDCKKSLSWLNPKHVDGTYLTFKSNGDCEI